MKQKTKQEDLMTRYLLGDLTEEEQTQIEEQFLADNEYFEQLGAVEDALIDDYAQGALGEYEHRKIESLLLSSSRQAREIDFVKDLIRYVSENPSEGLKKKDSIKRSGKLLSLPARLRIRNPGKRFSIAVALSLIAICLSMVIWNIALQRKIGRIEEQRAALERRGQDLQQQIDKQENSREETVRELEVERRKRDQLEQELAALQESRPMISNNDIAILDLKISTFSRGEGELRVVRIHPGISRFRIRIDLDQEAQYKSYGAVIKTFEGRKVWSRDQINPGQTYLGRLVLTVPASIFANDDYTLTLRGQTEAGEEVEIVDYSFRIKR